jgi:hypothetical protein
MWRTYALRWGLSPPPGGWENQEAILNVMHRLIVELGTFPHISAHMSATYLTSRGLALPPGVALKDGVLHDAREQSPS